MNTVRGTSHKYGLNIRSSYCAENLVTNNDLHNSGTAGSFNDAGTDTVTSPGNRL